MAEDDADRRREALLRFVDALALKPAPWARAAGVSPSALYNFLHKRSDSLSQPTLEALARAAARPVSELTGEVPVRLSGPVQAVTVVGTVEAGNWVEALEWPPEDQFRITVPRPRGPDGVFGLLVNGPSLNLRYPEGTILVCMPLAQLQRELRSGDRVIVERRNRDGLVEATVKELAFDADGRAWLWPRSDHPEHQQPLLIPWPPDVELHASESDVEEVNVTATVVGAYQPEE